jgi:3-methyladenine DNA glycosylase/8-oxoguanine DNA glycosylase
MRSPSVFEYLVKLLFTTNCTWSNTCTMTRNLAETLGPRSPSGRPIFPSPGEVQAASEAVLRKRVKAGYRAPHLRAIARAFQEGDLAQSTFDDDDATTDEIRQRLLALPGFGPYAAGQALRLLGRYDDLALDSWCRARYAALRELEEVPHDRAIEAEYADHGPWAGLVFWMDHTRDWHETRSRVKA